MSLSLKKSAKLTLRKEDNSVLEAVRVELKWVTPEPTIVKGRKWPYDVDASAFILDANGLALDNYKHFCFFQQPATPAIKSSGDDLGNNDDEESGEELIIDFTKVPKDGQSISIVITLYDSDVRNQHLSKITDGSLELFDANTNESLALTELSSLQPSDTSVLFVVLNRVGDEWEVENVNQGYDKNLDDWVALYKIDLDK